MRPLVCCGLVGLLWLAAPAVLAAPAPDLKPDPKEQEAVAALKELGAAVDRHKDDPHKSADYVSCPRAVRLDKALSLIRLLPRLHILDLSRTKVTDADLKELNSNRPLTDLDLSNTGISNAGLLHLLPLSNLRNLYLRRTALTDDGLAQLKHLPRLRSLWLCSGTVTDKGLIHIKDLGQLESLCLAGTQVTDEGAVPRPRPRPSP